MTSGPDGSVALAVPLSLASLEVLAALVLLATLPALATEGGTQPRETAVVAAASDLQPVFFELAAAFREARPGLDVTPTFGSSGNCHAQIRNGAPFDVFLSADVAYPASLVALGLADGPVFPYASGRLALVVPSTAPRPLDPPGLRLLLDAALGKVSIANPAHAPYGRAAEAALAKAGLLETLRPRLVLGENVSQAAQFVETAAAGAGIVALPLALAAERAGRLRHLALAPDAHPPFVQGGIVLGTARRRAAARAFRDFLATPEARAILARHGFDPPP